MSKDICLECGRDKNMVGKAHRCVPIPGWVKPRPPEAGPEIHEPPGEPTAFTPDPKPKAPPAKRKTAPQPTSEVEVEISDQAAAGLRRAVAGISAKQPKAKPRPENRKDKKVVTAYLEPEQVKRLRIMAAETGISMETLIGRMIDVEWSARGVKRT